MRFFLPFSSSLLLARIRLYAGIRDIYVYIYERYIDRVGDSFRNVTHVCQMEFSNIIRIARHHLVSILLFGFFIEFSSQSDCITFHFIRFGIYFEFWLLSLSLLYSSVTKSFINKLWRKKTYSHSHSHCSLTTLGQ